METSSPPKPLLYIKLVLVTLFWGGTFIAGKIASGVISPEVAAFGRFLVASIYLLIMLKMRVPAWPRPNSRQLLLIIAASLTGIIAYNLFFFRGLKLIPANRASLLIALNPIMIMSLSALFGVERLNARRVLGILIALFGVSVVLTRGDFSAIQGSIGRGELFIAGCVLSWGLYTLIGRQLVRDLPPLAVTTYASVAGTLGLLLPAIGELGSLPAAGWDVWLSVAYLGIFGTGLGFVWYYDGIKAIGPTRAGIFINMVPAWAVLLGALLLGEHVYLSTLLGGAFIITGVLLTNRARPHTPAGSPVQLE